MAFGRLGLTLQRSQLPTDLAQEILDAQQIRLGGIEAALGLLFSLAELEDARSLLDDRPAILGASIEDCIDLALADDHVLLSSDAGVTQQFLDVEEAATHAVDHVFGLAGPEQDACDGDLGEVHPECAVGVVDRDADLGTPEGGSLRRPGKDDVVHLL